MAWAKKGHTYHINKGEKNKKKTPRNLECVTPVSVSLAHQIHTYIHTHTHIHTYMDLPVHLWLDISRSPFQMTSPMATQKQVSQEAMAATKTRICIHIQTHEHHHIRVLVSLLGRGVGKSGGKTFLTTYIDRTKHLNLSHTKT